MPKLTPRETEVAQLASQGYKNSEIATILNPPTTENVVKNYMRSIYDKLGFSNRVELALWYIYKTEGEGK
jgi:DNA-binding NarL/FixJ family response regulator